MWIESENGTIINSSMIFTMFITKPGLSSGCVALCYTDPNADTYGIYEKLTEKNAKIIYENLKSALMVNINFFSKEQLLEGTRL